MKKTLIAGSIMTVLAFSGAAVASAQDNAPGGSADVNNDGATVQVKMTPQKIRQGIRQDARAQIKVMRADLRTAASSTRDDIKNMREDMRNASGTRKMDLKTEIENRKEDLANRRASTTMAIKGARFAETVKSAQSHLAQEMGRLTQIKSKIDTRLTKFQSQGVVTTAAQADLDLANAAIAAAQAKVAAVGSVQFSADASSTPATDGIRQAVKDAQSAINDAQKALMKVVSDMRGFEASAHANSTSTSETR